MGVPCLALEPPSTRSQPQPRSAACWAHRVPGTHARLPPPALSPHLEGSHFRSRSTSTRMFRKSRSGTESTVRPGQVFREPAQPVGGCCPILISYFAKGHCVGSQESGLKAARDQPCHSALTFGASSTFRRVGWGGGRWIRPLRSLSAPERTAESWTEKLGPALLPDCLGRPIVRTRESD